MIADEPLPPSDDLAPHVGRFTPRPRRSHRWASWIQIVLGLWLFASVVMWPHGPTSFTNTWMTGLLVSWFGALSLYVPWTRWLNAALGVWLAASSLLLGDVVAVTAPHNAILGLVVVACSLVPQRS